MVWGLAAFCCTRWSAKNARSNGPRSAILVDTAQDLSACGVGQRVLAGNGAQIDTTTTAGRLVFGIFVALAEFKWELIRVGTGGRRVRVGLDPSTWPEGRR